LFEDIHETGTTVLFATHDRSLLDVRPRRVVILDEGKATDVPAGLQEHTEDDGGDEDFDLEEEAA
jgi:cell division transport system ATP-binding protein